MARPRKTTQPQNEVEQMLSTEELVEVLKFAAQIYNTDPYGYFTPNINNQNIIDLNNNPEVPTKEKVTKALSDYKHNSEQLQAYSEFMEAFDMIYKRLVKYYAGMLSFDLDISCINAYAPDKDFKSDEYKEDLRRVYKFLDSFDYKHEFYKVVVELLRKQNYFTWFRDTQGTFNGDVIDLNDDKKHKTSKYMLQTMPQKYCKITGRWEYGYLYDFDMTYFTKAGTSIDSYDPVFRRYYKNVFVDGGNNQYIPTTPLQNRYGDFALWTQTSPDDNAWVFTFDENNIASTPFLAPNILNFLTNKEVEGLQKDKDMISARGILAGEIQLLDKQKSGQSTDAMAYNMKTLMKMLSLVKRGLNSNINAVAMPTASPKLYQFADSNADMVKNAVDNTVGQAVSASRIIYSSDKMSETEAKNAIITDFNMVAHLYPQFEHFLNFFVNKKTRKYKFAFKFSGCTYPFTREDMINRYTALMDKGVIFAPRTYAKVLDMTPMEFDRLLEEGKHSEWVDNLTSMMQSIYTQSGKDSNATGGMGSSNGGGRPNATDSQKADSTASK
jgi:hypothetical protein